MGKRQLARVLTAYATGKQVCPWHPWESDPSGYLRRNAIARGSWALVLVLAAIAPCFGQEGSGNANDGSGETPPSKDDAPPAVILVEGQVINHIGAGEEGVTITLRAKNADGEPGDVIATTTSDELGDFQITAPKPVKGQARVTLAKFGFVTATRDVELGAEEYPPFVDVEMEGNLPLVGAVHDARHNKPVGGASVTVKAVYRNWKAKTDERGKFIVKGIPPGEALLIVEADNYGREQRQVENVADFGEIIVLLKPERIVHIKTVDEAGKPVPRATVELLDQPRQDFRTLMTDAKGEVTVRGLHFDAGLLELRLFHQDYVSSMDFDRTIETTPEKVETRHTFTMKKAGRIVGRVIDAKTREPLGGARVVVGAEYSDFTPRDHTDFEGQFAVKGVEPGSAVVTVHRSGYAPELAEVQVRAGEETQLDVKLQPPRLLKGVVVSYSGNPVSGASVNATRWREHETLGLRAVTAPDGTFAIYDAPEDGFELSAIARDRATGEYDVKADDTNIKISLLEPPVVGDPGGDGARLKAGDAAPDFAVTTLDDVELKLADLKGKTVLLDFWATWCGPCLAEVPNLLAIYQAYGTRDDFVMISVSLDRNKTELLRFIEKHRMGWRHVFGDDAGVNKAADQYGVVGIPAVFLIGPDGKIIATDLRGPAGQKRVGKVLSENDSS